MKRFLILGFVALLGLPVAAQEADAVPQSPITLDILDAEDVELADFLWTSRLIVVFADTERDPAFQRQIELLAERPEPLLERDVIIVVDTDPVELSDIRKKLRPRGFSFVFIDKDGVVKLRKPAPWPVREITRSIDKTDLRIDELLDAGRPG